MLSAVVSMASVVCVCVLLLADVPMEEEWLVILLVGLCVAMF